MMALWTDMQCGDNEFFSKFQRISPAVDSLHKEIVQFYEYMKPLRVERSVRKQAVRRISSIILRNLPGVNKVSCFGSYKTGLCLPTSDIDLVVFGQWSSSPLTDLKDILIEHGVTTENNLKALDRASVPILKLTDSQTGIRFDISFNMLNGTKSIGVIKEFLSEFPPLRYLVLVLKHFLLQRYLNEVFTGGIGSYTLIMMTVSFLQLHPRTNCRIQSKCNLGQLLMDFFELYGRTFNYQRVAIRVRDEDPLDSLNDIGRGSYATSSVQAHFESAFMMLEKCTGFINSGIYKLNNISQISILGRIIGVNSRIVEYRNYISAMFKCDDEDHTDDDDFTVDDNDYEANDEGEEYDGNDEDDGVDNGSHKSKGESPPNMQANDDVDLTTADDEDNRSEPPSTSSDTIPSPAVTASTQSTAVQTTGNSKSDKDNRLVNGVSFVDGQPSDYSFANGFQQQPQRQLYQHLHIPHPLYFRYNFPTKYQHNNRYVNDDQYYYSSIPNRQQQLRNGRRFFNRQNNVLYRSNRSSSNHSAPGLFNGTDSVNSRY
ncbi:hypothetical protein GJ496_008187 [Pomphorhynchus laevis]|nr:hypothetical protein GJ496_008187 [Pomphorhynchus laevis]